MIRKLLLVAAAIAMPASAGAVTLVATAGPAGAVTPPAINCHITGTITFAGTSGLTHNGYATTATTSTTAVAGETLSNGTSTCVGSAKSLTIKSANTKCSASGATTQIPACVGHSTEYGYGSFKSYESTGLSSVKGDTKTITFTDNSVTYTSTTCTASSCVAAATCPKSKTYGTESGYKLEGTITAPATSPYKGKATTFIACIGAITGTHDLTQAGATKPGFVYNLLQGAGTTTADKAITVKTAIIDKTESSLAVAA